MEIQQEEALGAAVEAEGDGGEAEVVAVALSWHEDLAGTEV
jgi:hypothetical protein